MNRTDLIKKMTVRLQMGEKEVASFVKVWEEEVEKALIQEGGIVLMGFGAFTLWKQGARPGRNPKANTFCMIAPRNSVKFKPGKFLLQHLNNGMEIPDGNNKGKK